MREVSYLQELVLGRIRQTSAVKLLQLLAGEYALNSIYYVSA